MSVDLQRQLDDPRQSALTDHGVVEYLKPAHRSGSPAQLDVHHRPLLELRLAGEQLLEHREQLGSVDLGQEPQVPHVDAENRRPFGQGTGDRQQGTVAAEDDDQLVGAVGSEWRTDRQVAGSDRDLVERDLAPTLTQPVCELVCGLDRLAARPLGDDTDASELPNPLLSHQRAPSRPLFSPVRRLSPSGRRTGPTPRDCLGLPLRANRSGLGSRVRALRAPRSSR